MLLLCTKQDKNAEHDHGNAGNVGDEADDFVPMAYFITKDDFETFLNTFDDDPVVEMMDGKVLAHTLRIAEYLGIGDKEGHSYVQDFFSRVCSYSILGTHRGDVLNTQLYGRFESSVEQGSTMYTHLARGFANVFGLQIKIFEEKEGVRALALYTADSKHLMSGKCWVLE